LPFIEIEARSASLVIGDPVTSAACRVVIKLGPDDVKLRSIDHIRHLGVWKWALRSTCNEILLVAASSIVVLIKQDAKLFDGSDISVLIVCF
jgi:hypothetical protein